MFRKLPIFPSGTTISGEELNQILNSYNTENRPLCFLALIKNKFKCGDVFDEENSEEDDRYFTLSSHYYTWMKDAPLPLAYIPDSATIEIFENYKFRSNIIYIADPYSNNQHDDIEMHKFSLNLAKRYGMPLKDAVIQHITKTNNCRTIYHKLLELIDVNDWIELIDKKILPASAVPHNIIGHIASEQFQLFAKWVDDGTISENEIYQWFIAKIFNVDSQLELIKRNKFPLNAVEEEIFENLDIDVLHKWIDQRGHAWFYSPHIVNKFDKRTILKFVLDGKCHPTIISEQFVDELTVDEVMAIVRRTRYLLCAKCVSEFGVNEWLEVVKNRIQSINAVPDNIIEQMEMDHWVSLVKNRECRLDEVPNEIINEIGTDMLVKLIENYLIPDGQIVHTMVMDKFSPDILVRLIENGMWCDEDDILIKIDPDCLVRLLANRKISHIPELKINEIDHEMIVCAYMETGFDQIPEYLAHKFTSSQWIEWYLDDKCEYIPEPILCELTPDILCRCIEHNGRIYAQLNVSQVCQIDMNTQIKWIQDGVIDSYNFIHSVSAYLDLETSDVNIATYITNHIISMIDNGDPFIENLINKDSSMIDVFLSIIGDKIPLSVLAKWVECGKINTHNIPQKCAKLKCNDLNDQISIFSGDSDGDSLEMHISLCNMYDWIIDGPHKLSDFLENNTISTILDRFVKDGMVIMKSIRPDDYNKINKELLNSWIAQGLIVINN